MSRRGLGGSLVERARGKMLRQIGRLLPIWFSLALATLPTGCARMSRVSEKFADEVASLSLTKIEYPDLDAPALDNEISPERPLTIREMSQVGYWDLSLEETVQLALENSKVLRDLGGTVIRSPESSPTALDPAVVETDPRFGVEAALSAFDARFDTRLTGEKIDRRFNNQFLGNLGFLQADRDVWDTQIAKRAATGSLFSLRQHIDFDKDNSLGNEFPDGAFNVWYEAEARQPLLQGGGVNFNRIAGPGAAPGVNNGVLIARIRTDITLAEFEAGLRDFVSNVENAYWDLYYAYRDLDAKVRARDTALETWRRIHALYESERRGGEAEKEAQAREQYYRFEADVQDSLAGRPLDGTRTNNGSRPGTFRGLPGVLVAEKRLRLLMNVPTNCEMLIRTADEPPQASITFDWPTITTEALARRAELRRQRWNVKRRELELLAARNFLLPRLDLVGLYRFRGFGDDLLASDNTPRFNNAYADLVSGDFQEWQAGVEMSMALGFRQAHAGVRNAELHLSREKVLLDAQEREVVYDVAQAVAEMDRAYMVMQTNYNRWVASRHQLSAVEAAYADDRVQFIAVLDAQRRAAEAEAQQYRSRVEYAVAVKNVHFEKGTLLDYLGIFAAEGPWPGKAYDDAFHREVSRMRERQIPKNALIISKENQPPSVTLESPVAGGEAIVPGKITPPPQQPVPATEDTPAEVAEIAPSIKGVAFPNEPLPAPPADDERPAYRPKPLPPELPPARLVEPARFVPEPTPAPSGVKPEPQRPAMESPSIKGVDLPAQIAPAPPERSIVPALPPPVPVKPAPPPRPAAAPASQAPADSGPSIKGLIDLPAPAASAPAPQARSVVQPPSAPRPDPPKPLPQPATPPAPRTAPAATGPSIRGVAEPPAPPPAPRPAPPAPARPAPAIQGIGLPYDVGPPPPREDNFVVPASAIRRDPPPPLAPKPPAGSKAPPATGPSIKGIVEPPKLAPAPRAAPAQPAPSIQGVVEPLKSAPPPGPAPAKPAPAIKGT
jgi:outer membrane protein TolC